MPLKDNSLKRKYSIALKFISSVQFQMTSTIYYNLEIDIFSIRKRLIETYQANKKYISTEIVSHFFNGCTNNFIGYILKKLRFLYKIAVASSFSNKKSLKFISFWVILYYLKKNIYIFLRNILFFVWPYLTFLAIDK